ncbi:patatin-like phospholipase family protein [Subtercola boreus]|uniref:Phospholipase n=1 Tax=Subtercola boreus TaxID=120213 RepID=A0A3E0W998_9MICO|nr:patatin-like phospholipase family protein [Subtercola boreus]RFA20080.1 phospholipase [Subtercola boreus]RFA20210.1 phospholipase [Subtercola boreus]RFA26535.1 phospholipase [Subtercola boreus]
MSDEDLPTDRSGTRRAIVLGGGGVAGIAWETGLVSGLLELGIDLQRADVVVGTSAGSVVGVGLLAGSLGASYDALLADSGALDPAPGGPGDRDLSRTVKAIMAGFASTEGEDAARRSIGELALEDYQRSDDRESLARIRPLLPRTQWPDVELRITAVDAETGRFTVFTRDLDVELTSAVAASCAVPGVFKPLTINGHPYMDGGMRSATNADVAADCQAILVIACSVEAPVSGLGPTLPGTVDTLRGASDVFIVQADDERTAAFGTNPLLQSTARASARAGRRQASAVADAVRAFWG